MWRRLLNPGFSAALDRLLRSARFSSFRRLWAAAPRSVYRAGQQPSLGQIVETARPHFRLVSSSSGRLDYIETILQWRKRFAEPGFRKTLVKLELIPRWLTSADFRLAFTPGVSPNRVCFERELLDHHRVAFEKNAADPASTRPSSA